MCSTSSSQFQSDIFIINDKVTEVRNQSYSTLSTLFTRHQRSGWTLSWFNWFNFLSQFYTKILEQFCSSPVESTLVSLKYVCKCAKYWKANHTVVWMCEWLIDDQWSMINDQWLMINDQWSMINDWDEWICKNEIVLCLESFKWNMNADADPVVLL